MKKTAKLLWIAVLLLILFSMAVCDTGLSDTTPTVPASPYLGDYIVVSGWQAYERNNSSGRISTMHIPYKESDLNIKARVLNEYKYYWEVVGNGGKITNGKFSITVPPLTDDQLLTGDHLAAFFVDWNTPPEAHHVNIVSENGDDLRDEEIGNMILLTVEPANNVMLMREGFSGTRTSLSGEVIYHIYVKENCNIIAKERIMPSVDYTYAAFNLALKKGWNTVCMRETYTASGKSAFSAELRNPDLMWVLMEIPPDLVP